jgi:hypothetical protein
MSVIVYTAIFGGYDELKPHPDHPGVDEWLCITDDPDMRCSGWNVIVDEAEAPEVAEHPRMQAKWHKCYPPDNHAKSIWIDGSMLIHDPEFFTTVLELLDTADMVMFQHPSRTSIIDEARVSEQMVKYHGLPVVQQAMYYCNDWEWNDRELWASTTIGRNHTDPVFELGSAWFRECAEWTYQDQISLPPLLERYGIVPAALPHNLWRNPWFGLRGHASDL